MKDKKTIKHFFFDFAQYHVSDGLTDEVLLRVFYKENRFEIVHIKGDLNMRFREELSVFAGELLQRKHNTDFAKR